ncbi:MAG: TIGR00282 family metallophosphoesterase [Patescibacteria group bacterium]
MKILFFGDIIGKIGRNGLKKILPELKAEFEPDLTIANAENLAHGLGVTSKILQEMIESGIDIFTSGNHVLSKPEAEKLLTVPNPVLLRPANYVGEFPGVGFKVIPVGSKSVLVINLMGQVFIKDNFDNPFHKIDEILYKFQKDNLAAIIIDFHAEATSEKVAFGWYVDGQVSAVLGTHTHVPTADLRILPQGTAYISDVGMVGATDSVIGDKKEPIIQSFLAGTGPAIEIPEEGEVTVNGVFLEIDAKTKKTVNFSRVDRKVKV